MGCEHGAGGFYRPRQPKQTAFYQLVARFYPQFKACYQERYEQRYGFWRPAIDRFEARDLTDISRISVPGFAVLAIFDRWNGKTLTLITLEHTAQDLAVRLAAVLPAT